MHHVDPLFYYESTQPTKTRNASIPIEYFPLEKKRLSHNRIMDPYWRVHNSQGFASSKWSDADADAGKYYYIHMNSYDDTSHIKKLMDNVSPLLINPSRFEAGSYYTYMVASPCPRPSSHQMPILKPKPQLFATKVVNMFEFGTKHHQIMYRLSTQNSEENKMNNDEKKQDYVIYAAGEIMCENENTLIFNFISGTYMKGRISTRRRKYEEAYIMYMMKSIAPLYTNVIFQEEVLLTENTIPLTKEYLSILRRHNIPVFLHDTREKCNGMKYAIIRRSHHNIQNVTNDELQEIYKKIVAD